MPAQCAKPETAVQIAAGSLFVLIKMILEVNVITAMERCSRGTYDAELTRFAILNTWFINTLAQSPFS